jgi:hypothetical protein
MENNAQKILNFYYIEKQRYYARSLRNFFSDIKKKVVEAKEKLYI